MSPYRETPPGYDPDAHDLKQMIKRAEKEKKFCIVVPEYLKRGDVIENLKRALEMRVRPENIVLCSPKNYLINRDKTPLYRFSERIKKSGETIIYEVALDSAGRVKDIYRSTTTSKNVIV